MAPYLSFVKVGRIISIFSLVIYSGTSNKALDEKFSKAMSNGNSQKVMPFKEVKNTLNRDGDTRETFREARPT